MLAGVRAGRRVFQGMRNLAPETPKPLVKGAAVTGGSTRGHRGSIATVTLSTPSFIKG